MESKFPTANTTIQIGSSTPYQFEVTASDTGKKLLEFRDGYVHVEEDGANLVVSDQYDDKLPFSIEGSLGTEPNSLALSIVEANLLVLSTFENRGLEQVAFSLNLSDTAVRLRLAKPENGSPWFTDFKMWFHTRINRVAHENSA